MCALVFNGWAASPRAWELCRFRRDRIVSYLEPEPASATPGTIVVGWSLGGNRAIKFAAAHPDEVKALVLASPVVRMMKDRDWPGMGEKRLAALLGAFEMFQGQGLGDHEYRVNPYQFDSHEDLARGISYLHDSDARDAVLRLPETMPIFVFHAQNDIVSHVRNSTFIGEVCPWARVEIVAGGEHALPVTIPEKIDAAIDFLAAI